MKKVLVGSICAVLVIILGACAWWGRNPRPIFFECPNLEQAIREAEGYTGEPTGPIYPVDVLGIVRLWPDRSSSRNDPDQRGAITSLVGIEFLTNLERLRVESNQISDLSPIQNLTKLQDLRFSDNKVSDISAVRNLIQLRWLVFGTNQVSDLSPIENLSSLYHLLFWNNPVSNISALQNLDQLGYLNFDNTPVNDISALQHLTRLDTLHFSGCQVNDISVLQHLPNLDQLFFEDNLVTDISPLVANTSLTDTEIDMRRNNLDLTEGSQNRQDIQALIDRGCFVIFDPQND